MKLSNLHLPVSPINALILSLLFSFLFALPVSAADRPDTKIILALDASGRYLAAVKVGKGSAKIEFEVRPGETTALEVIIGE